MKRVIFLCLMSLFMGDIAFAYSTNSYAGGVVDNVSTGTVAWTNPQRVVGITNAIYATVGLDNQVSHYLYATNYGFNIPISATINGIVVSPTRKCSNSGNLSRDNNLRLVTNGVINVTDRATTTPYTLTDVTEDHGGVADTWGIALSPDMVNSTGFGVAFASYKIAPGSGVTISVDAIRITVYYTMPSGERRRVIGGYAH